LSGCSVGLTRSIVSGIGRTAVLLHSLSVVAITAINITTDAIVDIAVNVAANVARNA
jgi:hypothetical protein